MKTSSVVVLLLAASICIAANTVQQVRSFRDTGELIRARQLPLMLVLTRNGCQYCEALRKQVLHPILRSGEYAERAIIRELNIDSPGHYVDFDGRPVSAGDMAESWNASITPTVLLLDARGEELAERLVGVNNLDMYAFYLDRQLRRASAALQAIELEGENLEQEGAVNVD